MKFLGLLFLVTYLCTVPPEVSRIREAYPMAVKDEARAKELYDALSAITKDDTATLVAYKGAVTTLMAKFINGVRNKKDYFKAGVDLIEFAVVTEPENIEIRCLRLGVQENSPKVVGYKSEIQGDKEFLMEHYKSLRSEEIRKTIKQFVLQSQLFDSVEKGLF